ncbi:MAG: peptide chain release factor N(5)-glutamine methyltransferase [Epsilonproteobacteria bacterium]|nr:peptide chain release factor N(5)-glutamine methyltransferase [Campylobacterota bacterium]
MRVDALLALGTARLKGRVERPRLEAEILLAHLLGKPRIWLHTHPETEVACEAAFNALIGRRAEAEPVEYLTGKASFYDFELEVGKGVLIPRPETELLVDYAAKIIETKKIGRVCEIGVGSGAVSIALARRFPHLRIVATDISETALAYARRNIEAMGVAGQIETVACDLMERVDEGVEMVVSNPPYIADDFPLDATVRQEPAAALFGGRRGDEILRRIIDACVQRGVRDLVCEMGYDQRKPIAEHCRSLGLEMPEFYKDLAGLDRGFYLRIR